MKKPILLGCTLLLGILAIAGLSCGKSDDGATFDEEFGQQIGDAMSSVDEAATGTGGAFTELESSRRFLARVAPEELRPSDFTAWLIPDAYAAYCSSVDFQPCSANARVRNFNGCTIGIAGATATLNGTVTLSWAGTGAGSCAMVQSGDSVTRDPSFTLTGRRGAVLSVGKAEGASYGQRITRGTSSSTFSNGGIRRSFTRTGETAPIVDFSARTTTDISISGTGRANRVLNGGTLEVTNHLNEVSCSFSPSN
ncbi:MAG: hypothetical protein NDJ90_13865, partial [Oligoflexia bacterium]|nr:hypothetical protein [Oligoflexia bacterium]